MGNRPLTHEQLTLILNNYSRNGSLEIPADISSIQRQKLEFLTAIIPSELMRVYTFIFTVFHDLNSPPKNLTEGALEEMKKELRESLAETGRLRSQAGFDESEQEMLAFAAVEALTSLARW